MFELLFVVGLLGILTVTAWEWIAAQPAMGTIVVGLFAVPLTAWLEFGRLSRRYDLPPRVRRDFRAPCPPEAFYWSLRRARLLRQCVLLVPAALSAWLLAGWFPARAALDRESVIGWLAGIGAIYLLARVFAASCVYWHASQWLHPMRPAPAGWYRKFMFWMSEDAEFLGRMEKPSEAKARAVY
ncbi:MAG: hypothetical protein JSR82_07045 [Verrucomicrobia bacterium]|nr:hypothetical protein [Verrucomicrobiota bacterium]